MYDLGRLLELDVVEIATLHTFINSIILDLAEKPERNQEHIEVLNRVLTKIKKAKIIELKEE